ncbi:phosphoribosyltransferase-like protein [Tenacibaculum discolor]|uniref:phosphoribosyltransferase-like protein n=1 Tax=Tenacibaculum discolor TaxID=361581 RepID=UPI000EAB646C|nr:hypothetical protein [Tenacibaculum discolor]RLJ98799.1 hypothetical protein C8N27_2707 [Tenacibaculum discolor]
MDKKETMENFTSFALDKVYFYIESGFWSKLKMKELQNWVGNFKNHRERYCALKLLDRFVYYSEEDIIHLIKYGIYEKIVKRHLLQLEQKYNFIVSDEKIARAKDLFLKNIYFIKLDTGNPSQSSEAMLRYLKIDIGFPESNILDIKNLKAETLSKCNHLVIIDDFIGSGTQIRNFWNYGKVQLDDEEILLNKLEERFSNLSIEYFCLVCTEEGYDNFKYDFDMGVKNNLRITYGEILSNKFKVFGKESIYFDKSEIEYCKNLLQKLCDENGIPFLGYESLDYAVAFHHGIPDCSLPLFYRKNDNWNYLFRNKKTESNV